MRCPDTGYKCYFYGGVREHKTDLEETRYEIVVGGGNAETMFGEGGRDERYRRRGSWGEDRVHRRVEIADVENEAQERRRGATQAGQGVVIII